MNEFFIKLMLNQLLAFLASTIKNPKSVEKFKKYFQLAYDGLGTILTSLGVPIAPASSVRVAGAAKSSESQALAKAASEVLAA